MINKNFKFLLNNIKEKNKSKLITLYNLKKLNNNNTNKQDNILTNNDVVEKINKNDYYNILNKIKTELKNESIIKEKLLNKKLNWINDIIIVRKRNEDTENIIYKLLSDLKKYKIETIKYKNTNILKKFIYNKKKDLLYNHLINQNLGMSKIENKNSFKINKISNLKNENFKINQCIIIKENLLLKIKKEYVELVNFEKKNIKKFKQYNIIKKDIKNLVYSMEYLKNNDIKAININYEKYITNTKNIILLINNLIEKYSSMLINKNKLKNKINNWILKLKIKKDLYKNHESEFNNLGFLIEKNIDKFKFNEDIYDNLLNKNNITSKVLKDNEIVLLKLNFQIKFFLSTHIQIIINLYNYLKSNNIEIKKDFYLFTKVLKQNSQILTFKKDTSFNLNMILNNEDQIDYFKFKIGSLKFNSNKYILNKSDYYYFMQIFKNNELLKFYLNNSHISYSNKPGISMSKLINELYLRLIKDFNCNFMLYIDIIKFLNKDNSNIIIIKKKINMRTINNSRNLINIKKLSNQKVRFKSINKIFQSRVNSNTNKKNEIKDLNELKNYITRTSNYVKYNKNATSNNIKSKIYSDKNLDDASIVNIVNFKTRNLNHKKDYLNYKNSLNSMLKITINSKNNNQKDLNKVYLSILNNKNRNNYFKN